MTTIEKFCFLLTVHFHLHVAPNKCYFSVHSEARKRYDTQFTMAPNYSVHRRRLSRKFPFPNVARPRVIVERAMLSLWRLVGNWSSACIDGLHFHNTSEIIPRRTGTSSRSPRAQREMTKFVPSLNSGETGAQESAALHAGLHRIAPRML